MAASPAQIRDTLRKAAELITLHGYSKHGDGDGPYSAAVAIEHAAQMLNTDSMIIAHTVEEAAQVSFAGWLYLTHRATRLTSISDFADMVSTWEDYATPPRGHGPTAETVAGYLRQAADCIALYEVRDVASVTA